MIQAIKRNKKTNITMTKLQVRRDNSNSVDTTREGIEDKHKVNSKDNTKKMNTFCRECYTRRKPQIFFILCQNDQLLILRTFLTMWFFSEMCWLSSLQQRKISNICTNISTSDAGYQVYRLLATSLQVVSFLLGTRVIA